MDRALACDVGRLQPGTRRCAPISPRRSGRRWRTCASPTDSTRPRSPPSPPPPPPPPLLPPPLLPTPPRLPTRPPRRCTLCNSTTRTPRSAPGPHNTHSAQPMHYPRRAPSLSVLSADAGCLRHRPAPRLPTLRSCACTSARRSTARTSSRTRVTAAGAWNTYVVVFRARVTAE